MIQRLRRKIDEPDVMSLIATRRGEGYMFAALPADGSVR
jgi:DNA-binding response OmpR family regulator